MQQGLCVGHWSRTQGWLPLIKILYCCCCYCKNLGLGIVHCWCEAVMSNWLFRSTGELGGPPIYCFVMMSDSSCWCFDCMLAIPLIHTKFKYFFCSISNTCLAGAHSWGYPNTRGGQVEKVSPYCHAGHWRKGLVRKSTKCLTPSRYQDVHIKSKASKEKKTNLFMKCLCWCQPGENS